MFTKAILSTAVIAILAMGCSNQPTAPNSSQLNGETSMAGLEMARPTQPGVASDSADFGDNGFRRRQVTFKVRIENVSTVMTLHLSNGQTAPAPNSPGVWTITRAKNPLFEVEEYDLGLGLERQAEDGNPTNLAAGVMNNQLVRSTGIFDTPVGDTHPGPATPGKAYEFTVVGTPGDRLSFTSMFGQSNDLFYAPGRYGIPLFGLFGKPVEGDVTGWITLWDAGTEVNQEPGLGPDQAPRQSGPNTGASEHKRIYPVHDQYTYPRTNQVINVTITPVDVIS